MLLIIKKSDIDNCMQPNLQNPTKMHLQREGFEKEYLTKGLEFVLKKYAGMNLKSQMKCKYNEFKKSIKALIKT